MRAIIFHAFFLISISLFTFTFSSQGQISETKSTNVIEGTPEVAEAEARFNQITGESGKFFKEGLLNIEDNRRSQAGEKFDKSVEVFLMSGVNVSRNVKLQSCYNHLIETVYQIEFPSEKQLNQKIRTLSAVCSWNWNENDYTRADEVAKLVLTAPITNNSPVVAANNQINLAQGLNEQKFEASPLDELAKLELTAEEQEVAPKGKVALNIEEKHCSTLTSPVIQNLQLGMTVNQVSKKLNKNITLEKAEISSSEIYIASVSNLKGVEKLFLNFYKGKLFWIKVNYDNSIEWNGILEFQKTISKTLNLPNSWQSKSSIKKQLICKNFDIEIMGLSSTNYFLLMLTDTNAMQAMAKEKLLNDKKRKESVKSKKENFKP